MNIFHSAGPKSSWRNQSGSEDDGSGSESDDESDRSGSESREKKKERKKKKKANKADMVYTDAQLSGLLKDVIQNSAYTNTSEYFYVNSLQEFS